MPKVDDRRRALCALALRQQGCFSSEQAVSCGYSRRLQHYHVKKDHWKRLGRGVFRLSDFPFFPNQHLARWSLWTRSRRDIIQGVISHGSALYLNGLSDTDSALLHLTVPPSFRKKAPPGCQLYKFRLSPEDVEQREGFMVTSPARTIIDVAESGLPEELLKNAVRAAHNKALVLPYAFEGVKMSYRGMERLRDALSGAGIPAPYLDKGLNRSECENLRSFTIEVRGYFAQYPEETL